MLGTPPPPPPKRGLNVNELVMLKTMFYKLLQKMVCTNLEENQPIIATPRKIHFEIVSWNASMHQFVRTNCYNLFELFTNYSLVVNGKNERFRLLPKMAAISKCFDGLISSSNSTFILCIFNIRMCPFSRNRQETHKSAEMNCGDRHFTEQLLQISNDS